MRFKLFLGYMLFVMILMCQKLDQKVKHENLKCMGIMQDNLCHPYILSTTVLSDNYVSPFGVMGNFFYFSGS